MSEMPVLEMLVKNIYFGDNNVYRTCALRKIEEKNNNSETLVCASQDWYQKITNN